MTCNVTLNKIRDFSGTEYTSRQNILYNKRRVVLFFFILWQECYVSYLLGSRHQLSVLLLLFGNVFDVPDLVHFLAYPN